MIVKLLTVKYDLEKDHYMCQTILRRNQITAKPFKNTISRDPRL